MDTSVSEHMYRHITFREVEPHCEIFAHEDICIAGLGEGSLKLLQLVAGEVAVMLPLLPPVLGINSH